ncbi:MAG: hypothetical protein K2Z81_01600, partial [Cyanobacteria bacterium]|nr:hypothetical protein [Cyanobacteriota bacterium]
FFAISGSSLATAAYGYWRRLIEQLFGTRGTISIPELSTGRASGDQLLVNPFGFVRCIERLFSAQSDFGNALTSSASG